MAKKQVIRLTESDLHRIVKESVNKLLRENSRRKSNMIKEGGHLYHKDEDGKVFVYRKKPHRNSKDNYWHIAGGDNYKMVEVPIGFISWEDSEPFDLNNLSYEFSLFMKSF